MANRPRPSLGRTFIGLWCQHPLAKQTDISPLYIYIWSCNRPLPKREGSEYLTGTMAFHGEGAGFLSCAHAMAWISLAMQGGPSHVMGRGGPHARHGVESPRKGQDH